MTDDDTSINDSRRSVMKKGMVAAGALALGGSGTVTAQEGEDQTNGEDETEEGGAGEDGADEGDDDALTEEWDKAIMQTGTFRPAGRFIITSPVISWNPNVADIRDNLWSEYNTRSIRYLGDPTQYSFWQAHDAEVPDFNQERGYVVDAEGATGPDDTVQPEVFRMHTEYSPLGDAGYVTVNFTPVSEDEQEDWLDNDDWWTDDVDDEDMVGLDDV